MQVFTDIEAEREAGGLLQTILHHAFVLAIMPVGLVYNTMVWYGSGVYFFWGEITGAYHGLGKTHMRRAVAVGREAAAHPSAGDVLC